MIFYIARAADIVGRHRAALKLVEYVVIGLAHHRGENIKPAAMGHADDDLFDAKRAAAFDDLLKRRHHRLGAVKAETLRTRIFRVQKILKAFRFDQLFQDRLLAFGGEGDVLVGSFNAVLDPGFLLRVRDMHELHRERAAICSLQDFQNFPQARCLKAENVVDEYLPVHVGFGEAKARRIKLGMLVFILQSKRVEFGQQMAANAIGADQHQRTQRILRCLLYVAVRRRRAVRRALFDFGFDFGFECAPVAVERRRQLAVLLRRPIAARPARAFVIGPRGLAVVIQAVKIGLPFIAHRLRIVGVARILRFEILGVDAR